MTPKPTSPAAIAPSHSTGPDIKQWRRPQRSALSAHPVPIHANATVQMRADCASGTRQKFVDTPRAIGSAHQKVMPIGWRSQSLGLTEPMGAQLVGSLILRSPATATSTFGARELNGWTRYRPVRTEHAAVARFGCQRRPACGALEEIDAGVDRHDLGVPCATDRADQFRADDPYVRRCCRRHCETAVGLIPPTMACTWAAKARASRCGNCGVCGNPPS